VCDTSLVIALNILIDKLIIIVATSGKLQKNPGLPAKSSIQTGNFFTVYTVLFRLRFYSYTIVFELFATGTN